MPQPKLILLNAGVGVGKTTIAKRYSHDHPLTLDFAGDVLIELISDWRSHKAVVREAIFAMTLAATGAYLQTGKTVLLEYLLTDPAHAAAFEHVATQAGAGFYEVLLEVDKETAVRRLLARGHWGEANSPALTVADIPDIEALFDHMMVATKQRPSTVRIPVVEGDIEKTYQDFLVAVGE